MRHGSGAAGRAPPGRNPGRPPAGRRRVLRRSAAAPALALGVAAALAMSACGGAAGDLLALEVSGGFQDESVRLTVTEDGRGSCGHSELRPIASERLIEAREVERELEGLAEDGTSFGGDAPAERRSYVARTRAGTVRWVEGAPELPEVLPQAALLAQELQEELCP